MGQRNTWSFAKVRDEPSRKGTLSKACEGVGIRYEHLPELGIASDERRNLETQADYDALFAQYDTLLPDGNEVVALGDGIVQQVRN